MNIKPTVVHVTHEAIGKIGGIGAVLEGLHTSDAYWQSVDRSILIAPLFTREGNIHTRLGEDGEVLYSSIDGLVNTNYASAFQRIEQLFNVNIIYGRRTYTDPITGHSERPEVILIDIGRIAPESVNTLKGKMFSEYGIQSHHYEHLWEYEQYVRLAPPSIAALKILGAADKDMETIIVSHEFMGMPTALAGKLDPSHDFKTVFYAHEVAPIRQIVEKNPGHDTMFYNVMKHAEQEGISVDEVFGDQSHFFKASLVEASKYCDNILAVGDFVVEELKFLAPEFKHADIDLTYNGIPAYEITLEDKHKSRGKLKQYCENLLGYNPDYVFTHVTRMTPSKGLWRDLRVLEHMDKEFQTQNKTAILFVLSTEIGKRRNQDAYMMEASYNWPVAHREGMPDLSGGEANFHTGVQEFNAKCRNIKVVYVNQFGWTRQCCGSRMPYDMEFMDIRKGSDVEFGQSIYEPFGIAQLEALTFGGICVLTNICGCAGFVKAVNEGRDVKNVIIADYTDVPEIENYTIEQIKRIDAYQRDKIEYEISSKIALEICARLPKTDEDFSDLIQTGCEMAKHMGWEAVTEKYVLKSLRKAMMKRSLSNEDSLISV